MAENTASLNTPKGLVNRLEAALEAQALPAPRTQPLPNAAAARLRRRRTLSLVVLSALVVVFSALYLFAFVNPKYFEFAMSLRLPRYAGIATAAAAIAGASMIFQTLIRNTIVTPCLLGMNSLYVLVHTGVVFFLGSGSDFSTDPILSFLLDIVVMGTVAAVVYNAIFEKTGGNVLYVLLIGTVLSTFFGSVQSSLTRVMDPNEYDALLNSLVASFSNVNASVLIPGWILLGLIVLWLRRDLKLLDVIALERENAINLGVDYERTVRRLMTGVALSIAVATALVGPLSFLGLITANLARQLLQTHRHVPLIAGSVLIGVLILTAGQFFVEHVALYSVPVSVFVTVGGGLYFLYLILRAPKRG